MTIRLKRFRRVDNRNNTKQLKADKPIRTSVLCAGSSDENESFIICLFVCTYTCITRWYFALTKAFFYSLRRFIYSNDNLSLATILSDAILMEFHNSLRAEQLDAYSFLFTKDIKIRKRSGVVHQSTRWQCKKYNFDTGRNY